MPLAAVERQIASAVDVIVHLGRIRDGSRKVMRIVEVTGYEEGKVQMRSLYRFREKGEIHGKILGVLEKEEELADRTKLLAAGCREI